MTLDDIVDSMVSVLELSTDWQIRAYIRSKFTNVVNDERSRLAVILEACPCEHCQKCACIVLDGSAHDPR